MFHLLLDTDLGRAQTAEECLTWRWIMQSFNTAPHRRILGKLRRHTDYNRRPRAAGSYCLTEHGPSTLSSVVNLIWICDDAPESSLGAVVTPLQQTHTDALYATVGNAGHVLHLLTEVHSWSSHLVLTHPVDYGWVASAIKCMNVAVYKGWDGVNILHQEMISIIIDH